MKIAVTYQDGQVFQHFGHSEQFKLYTVEDGRALAGFLRQYGVDVLICGGIGGGARMALAEAGIQLYPGAAGDADAQVQALLNGNLAYNPDTQCDHHHHEHGGDCHSQGHGCGHKCH